MFRALVTVFLASLMVIVAGIALLLLGVVYASPRAVSWISTLWSRMILATSGTRVGVEGREHIADGRPLFFMGNHQSAVDIPVLITALRGRVRFMAKDSLFRIPIFGWVLSRYGYVPVHRGQTRKTARLLDVMFERLRRRPISILAFPEGTRSPDGRLLPFHRGTMKIGQRAGLDVVPFAIDGSIAVHRRGQFRLVPGAVRLCFMEPIAAGEVAAMSATELHERVRQAVLRGLRQVEEPPSATAAGVAARMESD